MKIKFAMVTVAAFSFAFTAGYACAREVHVPFHQLPAAVQKTAKKESRGASVRGYVKDVENGHTEYEVETIQNGMTKDVAIDATGHVLEVEQQVPMSEVPAAARASIEKGAAGGKVVRVEKVTSPMSPEVAYEAGVRLHGHYREVRVHANGSPAPESDED